MAVKAAAKKINGDSMPFTPNRRFRRDYDRTFRKDPLAANLLLLLAELADEHGHVTTDENELARLMATRFADPREYQLPRRPQK